MQYQGTLKFMHERGYGFLRADSGEDHFVHKSDLERSQINCDLLEPGRTRLAYNLKQDDRNKKLKAVELRIVD